MPYAWPLQVRPRVARDILTGDLAWLEGDLRPGLAGIASVACLTLHLSPARTTAPASRRRLTLRCQLSAATLRPACVGAVVVSIGGCSPWGWRSFWRRPGRVALMRRRTPPGPASRRAPEAARFAR